MCQTVASYSAIIGCSSPIEAAFGSERSMWQRQIHLRPFWPAQWRRPTGWGSWTMIASQSPSRPSAFSWLISQKSFHCSSLSVAGSPWSELCNSLVALKNSSLPKITFQCASMPTSRISGTIV